MIRVFAPLLLCAQLGPSPAWAQADPKAAAHQRYERGLAAFDDERFQDAADEFEAAYRISPAFAVLYNIGRVDVALGRSVEAVRAFEMYLAQGGASIDTSRRQEVLAAIDKQRTRIGTVTVRTEPAANFGPTNVSLLGGSSPVNSSVTDPLFMTTDGVYHYGMEWSRSRVCSP
jgi:hypothetical protein